MTILWSRTQFSLIIFRAAWGARCFVFSMLEQKAAAKSREAGGLLEACAVSPGCFGWSRMNQMQKQESERQKCFVISASDQWGRRGFIDSE